MSQATTIPLYFHAVIAEEPGADQPWLLSVDTYHLPASARAEGLLEPTRHREIADAFQRVLLLAEKLNAGWTIRRADTPGATLHGPQS